MARKEQSLLPVVGQESEYRDKLDGFNFFWREGKFIFRIPTHS